MSGEPGPSQPIRPQYAPTPLNRYEKLNVGGILFQTTLDTLAKQDTMLRALFTDSGGMTPTRDADGFVLIDRDGRHFHLVLNFLRDGKVTLPTPKEAKEELLAEARFYCIAELEKVVQEALDENVIGENICQVPLVCTSKQEQQVVQNSTRPVVKLLCNRHNNKYSYTNQSDDNFLKNIELFEKLAINFHHRIQFIKDQSCSSEICCWVFYGDKRKQAEVCCTAIVYGSDKKHTKIDFPEASIYKEVLYVLLFEDDGSRRSVLDTESLRKFWVVTAGSNNPPSVPSGQLSDEDAEELAQHAVHIRMRSQRR